MSKVWGWQGGTAPTSSKFYTGRGNPLVVALSRYQQEIHHLRSTQHQLKVFYLQHHLRI